MSKPDEQAVKEAAISNLDGLAGYLDAELGITADMPPEQVKEELRQMGLDPNLPLPSGIRQLLSEKGREPETVAADASGDADDGPPPAAAATKSSNVVVNDVNWARKSSPGKFAAFAGAAPGLFRRQTVHEPWQMEGDRTFLSPAIDTPGRHWEQVVLFPDRREGDYAIEVELTLLRGETLNDQLYKEAGVIIRYCGEGQYYYAGLGGFGARTFIGVVEQRAGSGVWSCLASMGKKDQTEFNRVYRLRVECKGNVISLYEDDRNRLSVEDGTYQAGYWGLRTVRTEARFANLKEAGPSTSKVTVIMPYTTPHSFVYDLVNSVVAREGHECCRADEPAVAQPVVYDLRQRIMNADLVIADLTGRNTNAYYGAGLAHALGKRLILTAQSKDDLTFDGGHIKTVVYNNPGDLQERLAHAMRELFLTAERRAG